MTVEPDDRGLAEAVRAAIVMERGDVAARFNVVRLVAIAGWGALALALGLGDRPEWLVPLPGLALWFVLALAMQLAAHRAAARRYLWLAVPLVDLPMAGLVQGWFIGVSNRPEVVAMFAVGIFASLVYVSQLSFTKRGVALTLVGALLGSWLVLRRASLPLPNLWSAALLLGCAAWVAIFSSSRIAQLVARIARAQRGRETELADLVAAKTRELVERNRDLVRAERLASIAMLVQGIAHELNNPIGYIAGNVPPLQRYVRFLNETATTLSDGRARTAEEIASTLRFDAKRDLAFVVADLATLAEDIAEGARRAKLIVGDLQRLTSGSGRVIDQVDVARIIDQTRALFAPRIAGNVGLTSEVQDVPLVRARAGEVEQLLVNLVDNALRAVGTNGTVAIELSRDGDQLVLAVRDTGCGMSEADRARACEPFFTTRAAGEGAGLGLAIVASIVDSHSGTLTIDSAPSQGTTITVRLPLDGAGLPLHVRDAEARRGPVDQT